MDWSNLLKIVSSKKAWAAVVAILFLLFGERAGVPVEQLTDAVWVIVSYILGQGLADLGLAVAGKK